MGSQHDRAARGHAKWQKLQCYTGYMTVPRFSFSHVTDHDLIAAVKNAAQQERHATVHLIASLMELDARRLYLREGCSSLFTYCTEVLHLSEHAAYGRIEAARAARRFPVLLDLLAEGALTLTAIGLLAPHLTPENQSQVLDAARHKSKRAVEHLVASLSPRPDVPATVRKLPEPKRRMMATEPLIGHVPRDQAPTVPVPNARHLRSGSSRQGRSRRSAIRSSSRWVATPTRSCAVRRTCLDIPYRTVTLQ